MRAKVTGGEDTTGGAPTASRRYEKAPANMSPGLIGETVGFYLIPLGLLNRHMQGRQNRMRGIGNARQRIDFQRHGVGALVGVLVQIDHGEVAVGGFDGGSGVGLTVASRLMVTLELPVRAVPSSDEGGRQQGDAEDQRVDSERGQREGRIGDLQLRGCHRGLGSGVVGDVDGHGVAGPSRSDRTVAAGVDFKASRQ